MVAPVPGKHRGNTDYLSSRWRVNLRAIANVDANMGDTWLIRICEEHEVARLRITDGYSRIELIDRNSR
jgi:hypothetical protein